jgi:transcriptional regulator with XRE-family HTH domain
MPTDYERAEADPERRLNLRREELILEVTEALVNAMVEAGIMRAELARRMGKTRGFVTQVFEGGRNLTLGTIAEIADALDCKVEVRVVSRKKASARKAPRAARSGVRG